MTETKHYQWTGLYCRTSTLMQESGLESQERALLEYCKGKGITQFKVYKDRGISGTKSSRPFLDSLMEDVSSGKVSCVVVPAFSRFARSTKHLLNALETFQKLDVNFISISESLDLNTGLGKAMFTIIAALATLEASIISERVKVGMRNAAAKGRRIGREKRVNRDLIIELKRKHNYSARKIGKLLGYHHSTVCKELKSA